MSFPSITKLELKNKRVFLRADLNVKIQNGQIIQDFRLIKTLPTINHIIKNGGKVILATHLGSPNPTNPDNLLNPNFSTKIIADWLIKKGYTVEFHPDLEKAKEHSKKTLSSIILLENLRFFKGEKEASLTFAEELASFADLYVNDAFGMVHRNHTSVTLLPSLFDEKKRAFGFLIESEIQNLKKLKENVEQPFVLVIGGSKIKDKVPMLEYFLNIQNDLRPSTILIGGAVSNVFLKAQQPSLETQSFDAKTIGIASKILESAVEKNIEIVLPKDVCTKNTDTSEYKIFDIPEIPPGVNCLDIGPKTIELFKEKIEKAKTIFTNGTMGFYEDAHFKNGSQEVLRAITSNAHALKFVGGGDTIGAVYLFELQDKFDFVSTGGGATLAFLSTKEPEQELPGLKAIF